MNSLLFITATFLLAVTNASCSGCAGAGQAPPGSGVFVDLQLLVDLPSPTPDLTRTDLAVGPCAHKNGVIPCSADSDCDATGAGLAVCRLGMCCFATETFNAATCECRCNGALCTGDDVCCYEAPGWEDMAPPDMLACRPRRMCEPPNREP